MPPPSLLSTTRVREASGVTTDVKRCSLLPVMNEVSCDKRCLRRINDAGVRPGQGCDCGA
jgi:hypothetical protein